MDLDFALFAPVPKRCLGHADHTCGFFNAKVIPERFRQVWARYQRTRTLSNFVTVEMIISGFSVSIPRPGRPLPFP